MLVLGIETATPQVGVAIGGHEGVIASFHTARDRRHAETLAPAIQFLCAQTQLELNDIGVVAVDIGPGLFTGLRVGLATAKAVAHACKVPMIGISSLDLAAFPARFSDRLIVSTVDARRGERRPAELADGFFQRRLVQRPALTPLQRRRRLSSTHSTGVVDDFNHQPLTERARHHHRRRVSSSLARPRRRPRPRPRQFRQFRLERGIGRAPK